jgi:hypothetical protein
MHSQGPARRSFSFTSPLLAKGRTADALEQYQLHRRAHAGQRAASR